MDEYKSYAHNPPHLFVPDAIYIVTGSTIGKVKYFDNETKRAFLQETLLERASQLNWKLEAWAILPNHYHFVARAPEEASTLPTLIRSIHSLSARYVNKLDNQPGRRIWHNYWDKCINSDKDYLARLHYVMLNPVKYGYVEIPEEYKFSSYVWFQEKSEIEFKREVFSSSIDCLSVEDD